MQRSSLIPPIKLHASGIPMGDVGRGGPRPATLCNGQEVRQLLQRSFEGSIFSKYSRDNESPFKSHDGFFRTYSSVRRRQSTLPRHRRKGVKPAQECLAQRMKATVRSVSSSHAPFMAHPQEVAKIIFEAVESA